MRTFLTMTAAVVAIATLTLCGAVHAQSQDYMRRQQQEMERQRVDSDIELRQQQDELDEMRQQLNEMREKMRRQQDCINQGNQGTLLELCTGR